MTIHCTVFSIETWNWGLHSNYERSWCSSESCDVFSNLASTNGNGCSSESASDTSCKNGFEMFLNILNLFHPIRFFIFSKCHEILAKDASGTLEKVFVQQIHCWCICKSKVPSSCRRSQCWQTRLKMRGVEFFVMPVGSQVSLLFIFCHLVAYYRFNLLDLVYDVCMLMFFESYPRCTRYIHVYDSLHVSYICSKHLQLPQK